MRRSRGFLIIAAALGLGTCGLLYRSVRATDTPAAAPASAATPPGGGSAPGSAELAALRQELAQLRAQVRTAAPRGAAEAGSAAPVSERDPRIDPEARADRERRHRELAAGADAAFRREAPDARWASTTTSAIQTALAATDLRDLARGVECRASRCRVEIADDGTGTLAKALPMLAHQVGSELPSMVAAPVEDAGTGPSVVLYLSRGGDAPAH